MLTLLASCGGGGGSTAGTGSSEPVLVVSPTPLNNGDLSLTLPSSGLGAAQLGVVIAQGDALSEAIGSYYQVARGIPAANVVRVNLTTGNATMSVGEFTAMKAEVDAKLPSGVQATLLTWTAPSRVVGSCAMGITSAMAFGFDSGYCGGGVATKASPYFDSESRKPWTDHQIRPSMMLGASSLEAARILIDRGIAADASYPAGDGYLIRTTDTARSVRALDDYTGLAALWAGKLQLQYIDNSTGSGSNSIKDRSNVLFYFTGLTQVPDLATLIFRPGAAADHLTSTGGFLPNGNGQMQATAWLEAGATASYGTVEEPYNYTQKFSRASVLIDQYYRGATLIEAYWKAVSWPGQGLFLGEPLAQPFRDSPSLKIVNGQYVISTRALRRNARYALQYRTAVTSSWIELAAITPATAQPQTLTAPLAPNAATELRWVGPCPVNVNQQCTLVSSN